MLFQQFLRGIRWPQFFATCIHRDILVVANPRFGLATFPLPSFQECRNAGRADRAVLIHPIYHEECADRSATTSPSISPVTPNPFRPGFSCCVILASNGCWSLSIDSSVTPARLAVSHFQCPVAQKMALGSIRGCSARVRYNKEWTIHAYTYPASDEGSERISVATLSVPAPFPRFNSLIFDEISGRIGILFSSPLSPPSFRFVDII